MKKYRSLIRVVEVQTDQVKCLIPGWSVHDPVYVKVDKIPEDLRPQLKPDFRMIMWCHLGADKQEKLECSDFSKAPDPDGNDGLA